MSFTISYPFKLIIKNPEEAKALLDTHQYMNEGVKYYLEKLLMFRQEKIFIGEDETGKRIYIEETEYKKQIEEFYLIKKTELGRNLTLTLDEFKTLMRELYICLVSSSMENKKGFPNAQQASLNIFSPLFDAESKGYILKEENNNISLIHKDYGKILLKRLRDNNLIPIFTKFTDIKKITAKLSPTALDRMIFAQAIEKLLSYESWCKLMIKERFDKEVKIKELENKCENKQERDKIFEILEKYEEERQKTFEQDSGFAKKGKFYITGRMLKGFDEIKEKWLKEKDRSEQNLINILNKYQTDNSKLVGDRNLFEFIIKLENQCLWNGDIDYLKIKRDINKNQIWLDRPEMPRFTMPDFKKHPLWYRYEDPSNSNFRNYKIEVVKDENYITIPLITERNNEYFEENYTFNLAKLKKLSENITFIPKSKNKEFEFIDSNDEEEDKKDQKKSKQYIKYCDTAKNTSYGKSGGIRLYFNRNELENYKDGKKMDSYTVFTLSIRDYKSLFAKEKLQPQIFNTVDNKITSLKIQKKFGNEEQTNFLSYFTQNQITKKDWMDEKTFQNVKELNEGIRVLSVDLGQRFFAAVSCFEIMSEIDNNKLFFNLNDQNHKIIRINDKNYYAKHIYSKTIKLSGEDDDLYKERKINKNYKLSYQERKNKIGIFTRQINKLNQLLKIIRNDEIDKEKFKELIETTKRYVKNTYNDGIIDWNNVDNKILSYENKEDVINLHKELDKKLEIDFKEFIRECRKPIFRSGGLSMQRIEFLEKLNKLKRKWVARTQKSAESIVLTPKFGYKLKEHINELKDNRVKQGVNYILMTALGYIKDNEIKNDSKKKQKEDWVKKNRACQIILMEKLTEYTFAEDRPREENSKLRMWSHRQIFNFLQQKASLWGILVGDVFAPYTSKCLSDNNAPGIRCHQVTKKDLIDNSWFLKIVVKDDAFCDLIEINKENVKNKSIKINDILPLRGGELFASIKDGKLHIVQADINASRNIAKRFLSQINPFRVVLKKDKDETFHLKNEPNYLKNYYSILNFVPTNEELTFFKVEENKDIKPTKRIKMDKHEKESTDEGDDYSKNQIALFRDDSGIFFDKSLWVDGKIFWSVVKNKMTKLLRERNNKKNGSK